MPTQSFWKQVRKVLLDPLSVENWDEEANYDSIVAVADLAAQVAATVNGDDQRNVNHRGLHLTVDVTAVGGTTPQVIVTIEGKDPRSGKYYTLLASAALTAAGTTVLKVFPGATAAANSVANDILPRTWRVKAVVSGGAGATITAKISGCVVR